MMIKKAVEVKTECIPVVKIMATLMSLIVSADTVGESKSSGLSNLQSHSEISN